MKTLRIFLVIILPVCFICVIGMPQKLYAEASADNKTKHRITIKECRDKITDERDAILADRRQLEEAKKTGDKATIERVKLETTQDIAKRKARIKELYKLIGDDNWFSISNKPDAP